MNDYKELIENLRMAGKSVELADGSFGIYLPTVEKCHNAADAIERLTKEYKELDELNDAVCKEYRKVKKERDAAVADLEKYGRWCVTCKHRDKSDFSPNCTPIKCSTDENEFWEWRGVQEDNDELIDVSKLVYRVAVDDNDRQIFYVSAEEIDNAPTVDAEPVRHGHWKLCVEDWRKQMEGDECSVCGFQHYGSRYNYCPHCGAKMMDEEG